MGRTSLQIIAVIVILAVVAHCTGCVCFKPWPVIGKPWMHSPVVDGFTEEEAKAIIERNAAERERAIKPYHLKIS